MKKDKPNDSKRLRGLLKFTLSTKGLTITDLAKMHGMTGPSLCNAFYVPFPKAERIIADALNFKPQELWPSRYDSNGKPNRPNLWYQRKRGLWKPKNTTKGIKVNREKEDYSNGTTDKG